MRKAISTGILLFIIITTFSFSFLYYSFNLSEPENIVNRLLRKRILVYPSLRKIFRLQQVGDGRYEYMYHRALPLEIYLYNQEGITLEEGTLEKIKREMLYATHKYAPITVHPPKTLYGIADHITDDDIEISCYTLTAHMEKENTFMIEGEELVRQVPASKVLPFAGLSARSDSQVYEQIRGIYEDMKKKD